MMISFVLSLIVTIFIGNPDQSNSNESQGLTNDNYPIIKLDNIHNQASGEPHAKFYRVNPSEGLTIDATGYDFPFPKKLKEKKVTIVQFVVDGNIYHAKWDESNIVTIDKETLTKIKGDKSFEGFKDNMTIMVGLGTDQQVGENPSPIANVVYALIIKIIGQDG